MVSERSTRRPPRRHTTKPIIIVIADARHRPVDRIIIVVDRRRNVKAESRRAAKPIDWPGQPSGGKLLDPSIGPTGWLGWVGLMSRGIGHTPKENRHQRDRVERHHQPSQISDPLQSLLKVHALPKENKTVGQEDSAAFTYQHLDDPLVTTTPRSTKVSSRMHTDTIGASCQLSPLVRLDWNWTPASVI